MVKRLECTQTYTGVKWIHEADYDALKAAHEQIVRLCTQLPFDGVLAVTISRKALGLESETPAKHMEGCRCPECDPDFNDPRGDANG